MKRLCRQHIRCDLFPGEVDPPIPNYSSEAPDPLFFASSGYDYYFPYRPPRIGTPSLYVARDCNNSAFSVLSQEIADLMAQINAIICQSDDPSSLFYNITQTAHASCGGNPLATFYYTVVPGLFAGTSQDAANAQALAYAQSKVAEYIDHYCLGTPTNPIPQVPPQEPPVRPNGIIPGMPHLQASPGWVCFGDELDPALNVYAVTGPNSGNDFNWSLVSGALPVGVDLLKYDHNRAWLSGTPLATGTFTYTIRATRTDLPYIFAEVTDTLHVFGITNGTLPDATVGTPYSYQLASDGGVAPVIFTLIGSLPPGLTLSGTGLISGTPA